MASMCNFCSNPLRCPPSNTSAYCSNRAETRPCSGAVVGNFVGCAPSCVGDLQDLVGT